MRSCSDSFLFPAYVVLDDYPRPLICEVLYERNHGLDSVSLIVEDFEMKKQVNAWSEFLEWKAFLCPALRRMEVSKSKLLFLFFKPIF